MWLLAAGVLQCGQNMRRCSSDTIHSWRVATGGHTNTHTWYAPLHALLAARQPPRWPTPWPAGFTIQFTTNITWNNPAPRELQSVGATLYYAGGVDGVHAQRIDHDSGNVECINFYSTHGPCSLLSNANGTYRLLPPPTQQKPCCLDLPSVPYLPPSWGNTSDVRHAGVVLEPVSGGKCHLWQYPSTGNCSVFGQGQDSGCHQYLERVTDGLPVMFAFPGSGGLEDFHFRLDTMSIADPDPAHFTIGETCVRAKCSAGESSTHSNGFRVDYNKQPRRLTIVDRDLSVWSGVDMSQLSAEDANGTHPICRERAGGPTVDALALMKKAGVNTFRMRQWVQPCADGRCNASQWSYAGQAGVLLMARRCKEAGLSFVLDLHYSDWWADPGKQQKPRAWLHLSYSDLADQVYNYTLNVVRALVEQNTPPYAVQIGNEITHGLLWENRTDGQNCSQGGRLWCGGQADYQRMGHLLCMGIRGAKDATGLQGTKIAIHTDLGNHICNPAVGGCAKGIASVIRWYSNLSAALVNDPAGECGFDLIGLSTYPKWSNGTVFESITQMGKLAAAFPTHKVYVAETSYPAAADVCKRCPHCRPCKPPLQAGYPPTDAGQLQFVRDVRSSLDKALGKQNGGFLWWEGSEKSWTSLFGTGYTPDTTGQYVARPALLEGFQ